MNKLLPLLFLLITFSASNAQRNALFFKKRNKTIASFWVGSIIAFQLENKDWRKGEITKIQNDSIYIRPRVIRYSFMGTDTMHFNIEGYALSDIYAMPKKGYLIDYKDGRWQIDRAAGHVHFYWIKSGWLFRTGAAGYAALDLVNGAIRGDYTFKGSRLGIASGVFALGVMLKITYKPVLRTGKKYRFETFSL